MYSFHKPKHFHKGQSLIEYAVVISLVAAVMVAMYTYVMRSVQAVQKQVEDSAQ
jgi:Flp pilus assembly pilin Flp